MSYQACPELIEGMVLLQDTLYFFVGAASSRDLRVAPGMPLLRYITYEFTPNRELIRTVEGLNRVRPLLGQTLGSAPTLKTF